MATYVTPQGEVTQDFERYKEEFDRYYGPNGASPEEAEQAARDLPASTGGGLLPPPAPTPLTVPPTVPPPPRVASAPPTEDTFRMAFQRAVGRPISDAEYNDNAFLAKLSNDLFVLLPITRQATFSAADRLSLLPNNLLNPVIAEILRTNPAGLSQFPASRLAQFPIDAINGFIQQEDRVNPGGDLARQLREAVTKAGGTPPSPAAGAPAPAPAPAPTTPGLTPPPAGPTPTTSSEPIPDTHPWVSEVGANEWAQALRRSGVEWKDITITRLRADMKAVWEKRKADPKYAASYRYASEYYARTGWWPTEVEFNRFTQNTPLPALSPDGTSFIPKSGEKGAEGDYPKWEVPTTPDGKTVPLPPKYEWRFSADGTPIPYFTGGALEKDVFAGWYQDPKSGNWSYNPLLGAADYLSGGDSRWTDLIGGYVAHTGRLPDIETARQLASSLWAGASPDAQARASQFAQANGFWPTPFELEFGAAADTDANGPTGAAGQPGMGQVPVFVPGVGVVLTQGQAVGPGGFVFDPMSGIPGAVRPWVREILNGRMTLAQVPAEVRDWAIFSLSQFSKSLPTKRVEELKLSGLPTSPLQPFTTPFGAPMPVALMDEPLQQAEFLTAWKTLLPGQPEPTDAQMKDVAFLSQLDSKITQYLPSSTLRQFPLSALAVFGNDVLLKKVPDVIAKFPTGRKAQFGKGDLENLITDPIDRANLGLVTAEEKKAAAPAATAAAPPTTPTPAGTQPVPASQSAPFTPTLPPPVPFTAPVPSLLSPPGTEGQTALTSVPPAPPTGLTPPPEETEEERRRRLGLVGAGV